MPCLIVFSLCFLHLSSLDSRTLLRIYLSALSVPTQPPPCQPEQVSEQVSQISSDPLVPGVMLFENQLLLVLLAIQSLYCPCSCVTRPGCFHVLEAQASSPLSSCQEQSPGLCSILIKNKGLGAHRLNPDLAGCQPGSLREVICFCFFKLFRALICLLVT